MNVFTDDPAFRYRGIHVRSARDDAVQVLRGAGFRLGRCGPGRSLYKPDKRTTFDLYRGEVATILRPARSGRLRARLAATDQDLPPVDPSGADGRPASARPAGTRR